MKKNEGATDKHAETFFSEKTLEYGTNPKHHGDMDRPDGHARVTGPCGDTAEIYLRIQEAIIREAKFVTDGCMYSLAACNAAAHLAIGKTLHQCFSIDQRTILDHLKGLPDDHAHCALLAATTLYKAVSDHIVNHTAPPATNPKPPREPQKPRHTTQGRPTSRSRANYAMRRAG
jgi:nitrogen fixation protein NifU and related proteins